MSLKEETSCRYGITLWLLVLVVQPKASRWLLHDAGCLVSVRATTAARGANNYVQRYQNHAVPTYPFRRFCTVNSRGWHVDYRCLSKCGFGDQYVRSEWENSQVAADTFGQWCSETHWISDIIYKPSVTAFMAEAERLGARTIGGAGILAGKVHWHFHCLLGMMESLYNESNTVVDFNVESGPHERTRNASN